MIPLAVGAQSLVDRRPDDRAYDWRQRSMEGLANGGTVWAAGAIPAGGFFKTLAAQQVPFVAGPYLTTPFVANRFPTAKETGQQAALGLAMPLAHKLMGGGLAELQPQALPEPQARQVSSGASPRQQDLGTDAPVYANPPIPDSSKEIALNIAQRLGFGSLPSRRDALKLIAAHPDTAPNVRAALHAILNGEIQPRGAPEFSINRGGLSGANLSDPTTAVVRTSPEMIEALKSRGVAGDDKSIMLRGPKGSEGEPDREASVTRKERPGENDAEYQPLAGHPSDPNVRGGPGNYRGRFNAALAADGQPRLPDDWDTHHTRPQQLEDVDSPNRHLVEGIDRHHPSQLRGVPGYRQPGTVRVTEPSGRARTTNPHAEMDYEIEQFLKTEPTRTEFEQFLKYMDWRWGHVFWERGAGR
ncbi:MAG TPA: hypothetical protein VKJ45_16170 [Blastocatellia bacterium]|nr:hypothetical protein [Blastocatellia bacterium]